MLEWSTYTSAQKGFWQAKPGRGKKRTTNNQNPKPKSPLHLLFTECLVLQAGSTCFSTGQRLEVVTASLFFRWIRHEWQVSRVPPGVAAKLKLKMTARKLLLSWKLHRLVLCISIKEKVSLKGNQLSLQMCIHPYAPTSRIHYFLSEDQKITCQ